MNTATDQSAFSHVGYTFDDSQGRLEALGDVSLDIAPGEIVAVVGSSGAGKSTLLRLYAGLLEPTRGTLRRPAGRIGMVFQDFALFPWLSAKENVEFGLLMQGAPAAARKRVAEAMLEETGLRAFRDRHPRALSGGQRQRVGVARALAIEPDVLLLDEPFSALDSITADHLKKDLLAIWQKRRFAALIVVHTVADAVELADRIAVLGGRPATITRVFENHLPRPRTMRDPKAFELIDAVVAKIEE